MTTKVLVSEYSRRVAHELDDKHYAWIMLRRRDELIEPSDPAPVELTRPDHLSILSDYGNMEANYQRIYERRTQLEAQLFAAKTEMSRPIRRHELSKYDAHINAIQGELVYFTLFQRRLKQVLKAVTKLTSNNKRQRSLVISGGMTDVALLAELQDAVISALKANEIDVLRSALNANNYRLANAIRDAIESAGHKMIMSNQNVNVFIDGILAMECEIERQT